jgi:hypothetical protein
MGDDQRVGPRGGQGKALACFSAQHMLHRHRFARTQQRAVKNGVGALVGAGLGAGGHVEAPGLDAALPVAPGEGHVLHAVGACVARAHKVGAAAFAIVAPVVAAAGVGRQAFDAGNALRVGQGVGQFVAAAVGHPHRGACTGWPLSSVVTQASAFSRPSLKCTPRLVTSAEVRTNIVRASPWRSSSSEAPSFCEAISTTWKPGASGMPTTSNGRGSLLAGLGRSSVLTPPLPASSDSMRDCT